MTLEAFLAAFFDESFGELCDAVFEARHGNLLSTYLRLKQKQTRERLTRYYHAAREGLIEKPADRPGLQGPHTPAPSKQNGVLSPR